MFQKNKANTYRLVCENFQPHIPFTSSHLPYNHYKERENLNPALVLHHSLHTFLTPTQSQRSLDWQQEGIKDIFSKI